MATVPTTIRFPFPDTVANIPANWARDTDFDAQYPYVVGAGVDPTTISGGSATHLHPITPAAHNFSAGAASGTKKFYSGVVAAPATTTHTHGAVAVNTAAIDSGNADNNPVHIDLIFIKPSDGSQVGIPSGAWAFSDSSVFTGWSAQASADEKLLRGAATDADANLVSSGSNTHTHTGTHSHAAKNSANSSAGEGKVISSASVDAAMHPHYHSVSWGSYNPGISSKTLVPKWQKLLVVQNDNASADLPDGVIGVSRDDSPPTDWSQITFTAWYGFIMGDNAAAGATGGQVDAHTHTGNAHTGHAPTAGNANSVKGPQDYITTSYCADYHYHTWSITSATDTIGENDSDFGYPSAYPPYIGVQLWKYTAPSTGIRTLALTGVGT